ncbi:MAG TPA: hypothetical protein VFQ22_09080, partial [Longimicrobiales bacterium]|nr:hypothetical protein [Longimicrobiales bacterium]
MRPGRTRRLGLVGAALALLAVAAVAALLVLPRATAVGEPPPAYDLEPLPAGVDTLTPLAER